MTVEEFVVAGWLFVSLFFFNLILKTHEALLAHTHTDTEPQRVTRPFERPPLCVWDHQRMLVRQAGSSHSSALVVLGRNPTIEGPPSQEGYTMGVLVLVFEGVWACVCEGRAV